MWVYPNGDYAICLSEDMNSGTFGHPWEQTICIFGKELIEITRTNLPLNFSKVLRENVGSPEMWLMESKIYFGKAKLKFGLQ